MIKIDKLKNIVDSLVLYSSFNIIIISQKEEYIKNIIDYLLQVSPYRFEVVYIDKAEKLMEIYNKQNRFVGIMIAENAEAFIERTKAYLLEVFTSYNYEENQVAEEKVIKEMPNIIRKLNARFLYIDQETDSEVKEHIALNE